LGGKCTWQMLKYMCLRMVSCAKPLNKGTHKSKVMESQAYNGDKFSFFVLKILLISSWIQTQQREKSDVHSAFIAEVSGCPKAKP